MTAAVDFMFRVESFPGDNMLLTTCPKCQHNFPLPSPCCQVSATLTLPSTSSTSCTMRVQVGMSGGGIIQDNSESVILQKGFSGGQLVVNCQSPEPSPSAPIAFILPSTSGGSWTLPPPESDLERLSSTVKALRQSGWYYEGLSWQGSSTLLKAEDPGTFLVRDSSDPRFLFSLSVQTKRGPTSVRLHYHDGNFRLDAAPKLVPIMPVFPCVVRLVEYYVSVTGGRRGVEVSDRGREQVWIDCNGQTYSNILLTRPLYQKGRIPSLQHLARLTVNRHGRYVPAGQLPGSLNKYLEEYPYTQ